MMPTTMLLPRPTGCPCGCPAGVHECAVGLPAPDPSPCVGGCLAMGSTWMAHSATLGSCAICGVDFPVAGEEVAA